MVFVEDDGGSKTPCRVNASSSYGDGSQMNQEDCESNGKGSQNLQKNHELHNESMPLIQNTLIVFLISQINLQQLQEYIYICDVIGNLNVQAKLSKRHAWLACGLWRSKNHQQTTLISNN